MMSTGMGGVQQEEGFGLLFGKVGVSGGRKVVGACVEGTVPSLGRRDEGITNSKLSKSKLCSQKR